MNRLIGSTRKGRYYILVQLLGIVKDLYDLSILYAYTVIKDVHTIVLNENLHLGIFMYNKL